jgi:hypothetical protein
MKKTIKKLLEQQVQKNGRKELSRISYESELSESIVRKLYKGNYGHSLSANSMTKLAKALKVNVKELFDEVDQVA